jgi:hypothetical protein
MTYKMGCIVEVGVVDRSFRLNNDFRLRGGATRLSIDLSDVCMAYELLTPS